MKQTSLPENPPQNQSFFQSRQTCIENAQKYLLFFFKKIIISCRSFSVLSSFLQNIIYNTAIIFPVTVWAEYWKAIG